MRRIPLTLGLGVAVVMFAAGCATSGLDQPGSAPAATTGPAPTGAPITLGLTNQEGSALGSFTELRQAAQAAVQYVNSELGGVHGRPLKLVTCVTDGSPEGSRKCTDQVMESKPLAVIGGPDTGIQASMPIYTEANVPYLGGSPISPPQLTAPNSVQFTGFAAGALPALALYAADTLHAKKVSVIYPDVPGGRPEFDAFIGSVLHARGVSDITFIPADLQQPDRTAAVAAAAQAHPDTIIAVEAGGGCDSLLQARQTLGVQANFLVTQNCLESSVLNSVGTAAEGVYTESDFDGVAPSDSPDVKVFEQKLAQYAPRDISMTEFAWAGFASVMNIVRTLQALPANQLTSADLLRTMKAARNAPNFMAAPYTCDSPVKVAPAVCDSAARILEVKNGQLVDTGMGWINASAYVS
jgi:branched-chain amino acid transport system substrate-binding protein